MHEIIFERKGDVGILSIHQPPQNYLSRPDFVELDQLKEFVGSGIKSLVIQGSGRHFSAGADLNSIKKQISKLNNFSDQMVKGNQVLNYIDNLNIPVIAAVSGVCFGAGLEIALSCDIRICEENSLFAFPEINHDLFPGLGGGRRIIELTGKLIALELLLSGDMINANKALELGIVDEVVSKKQANEYAEELAQKMTNNRPLQVINAVMQSINNCRDLDTAEQIESDAVSFTKLAMEAFGKTNSDS